METALITGASGGIGLELAGIMASKGHNLVLTARSLDKLNETAEELAAKHGIKVSVIAKDLSVISSCREIYDELQKENINIGILVNNAGFGDFGPFAGSDWVKTYRMIELNITALTYLSRLFVKDMILRKKGKVMNVASTAAFQPGPLMAVYYASKAYVLSFSEALANELKPQGITVTALCPGPTRSGFQKAASIDESRFLKRRNIPSSKEAAAYGYEAMMKGKTVAIHGTFNFMLANAGRFAPRNLVTSIVKLIQEKTKI